MPNHVLRKKAQTLASDEKEALVNAFLHLKKEGRYDQYVHWHHAVMEPAIYSNEPHDPDYRNGAHRGPAFGPWHREFLLQVEADLKNIDSGLSIPYWDWTEDAALDDPTGSPIWRDDFMGGNGIETDSWRVGTGPFAFKNGNWPIPVGHDGPALRRQFGGTLPTLPTKDDLALAMHEAYYDTPNYNSSPFTIGFRNRLEGWITQRGDNRVKLPGSQLHNRVHLWVGGSMEPMTSPNDPIFFLHHCFVDKIWSDWQAQQKQDSPDAPLYAPEKDGPPGHNLDDQLKPWQHTVRNVLDIAGLGYQYERSPANQHFLAMIAEQRRARSARSPFWAD